MGKPAPGCNLKVGEFSSYICPLKQVFHLIPTGGVSGYDGDCFIAQNVLFGFTTGITLKLSVTKPHTLGKKLSSKHCKQINANLIIYKNFKRIP